MRVCITTTNRKVGDHIYDLLTDPLSGHGCLLGSKLCIDDHNMVPDIMEFDLTEEEIHSVEKLDGVKSVLLSGIAKPSLLAYDIKYQKVRTPDATFRNASYTFCNNISTPQYPRTAPPVNLAPAHLYYSTNHSPNFTQNVPATNSSTTPAYSIDCQGVDILILDTGVDPSCEDLKDIYGKNLVQEFDWSQVVDPYKPNPDNTYSTSIIAQDGYSGMSSNYYVDTNGHGTACASTVAGFKCGLAKNAKIYTLNSIELGAKFGFAHSTCLKLALGFQFGKLNGWYGLNPNTPTVFTNSWSFNTGRVVGVAYVNPTPGPNGTFNYQIAQAGPIGTPSGLTKPISPIGNNNSNNIDGNNNDGLLSSSFDLGGTQLANSVCTTIPYAVATNQAQAVYNNLLPAFEATSDAYFRTLLDLGMHCVVGAGNNNLELNQVDPTIIPILVFRDSSNNNFVSLRQMVIGSDGKYQDNAAGLTAGSVYTISGATYTYIGTWQIYLNYQSPDIGAGVSRNSYPLIKVGCVTPLGNIDSSVNTFDTGGYTRSIYNILNGLNLACLNAYGYPNNPPGILDTLIINIGTGQANQINNGPFGSGGINIPNMGILFNDGFNNTNLRYGWNTNTFKIDTPIYVKSPYSNFGPAVDIYAVGSANWAGLSNQKLDGTNQHYSITGGISANREAPYFRDTSTTYGAGYQGKFVFANGTSSACPAVAGCLATFLQQYPRSTPREARNWLTGSSIKGSIMTTCRTPYVSSLSGTSATPGAGRFGVTFNGTDVTSVNFGSLGVIQGNSRPYNNTWIVDTSTTSIFFNCPHQTLRNTNYFWTSAYHDRFDKNGNNFNIGVSMLYDILFGCRFFNNSNNRIAQAYPSRSSVYFATTNTRYASAMYLNQNGVSIPSTRLYIGSPTTERVTHQPSEYFTSTAL